MKDSKIMYCDQRNKVTWHVFIIDEIEKFTIIKCRECGSEDIINL